MTVELSLFPSGVLKTLAAGGHAGAGKPGSDPVCAAVSVLVRTALNAFYKEHNLEIEGSAPREGEARLAIAAYDKAAEARLRGLTDFLLTGLFDLAAEHPRHLRVSFKNDTTEE